MDVVKLAASLDAPGSRDEVSLTLPEQLSFDEWEAIGRPLFSQATASMWWLGDWCRYGKGRWPERYVQASDTTGVAVETARKAERVAEAFPDSGRRRPGLSFGHHEEIAKLPDSEREEWLDRAEEGGWTVHETRRKVRRWRDSVTDGAPDVAAPGLFDDPVARVRVAIDGDREHLDTYTSVAAAMAQAVKERFRQLDVPAEVSVQVEQ